MTLKKAYINLTITLLLFILSIVLFVLNVSSNYVFWYHIAFYISIGLTMILTIGFIYVLSHHQLKEKVTAKVLDTMDWISFMLQSFSVILIIFMFFFFSSTIQQTSMYPTLNEGNIVIANQFKYEPSRGDIVIINVRAEEHPGEAEKLLVKRLVGLPGDLITFVESPNDNGYQILINGEVYSFNEQVYIARYVTNEKSIMEAALDENNRIKDNEYFVFGDNESNSKDSRNLGAFEKDDIIGHVIYRIWPFGALS